MKKIHKFFSKDLLHILGAVGIFVAFLISIAYKQVGIGALIAAWLIAMAIIGVAWITDIRKADLLKNGKIVSGKVNAVKRVHIKFHMSTYHLADEDVIKIAKEKEAEKQLNYIIDCKASFLPLVSVQTFLTYYRDNKEIDFAKYQEKNYKFEKLNNIKVPLFMRWGNVNEIINLPANELVNLMNEKILNNKKDINFIDGATHNYRGKEETLAEEILKFIQNIN